MATPLSLKTEALVSRARVIGFPVLCGLSSMVGRERDLNLIVATLARAETPVLGDTRAESPATLS